MALIVLNPIIPVSVGSTKFSANALDTRTRHLASNGLMRLFVLGFLVPALGLAALLPETLGTYHRGASSKPSLAAADMLVWEEFGLKDPETAVYEDGAKHFTATIYRLLDSTAAI